MKGQKELEQCNGAKMITVPRKSKTKSRRRELTTFETTSVADTRGVELFLRRREGEREGREWRGGASEAIRGRESTLPRAETRTSGREIERVISTVGSSKRKRSLKKTNYILPR